MDISPLPPSVFHLSIGALEVGILVAVTLFGVINVQAVIYFKTRQPNEPAFLKVLIGIIWLLQILHTIFLSHSLYVLTVSDYGGYAFLQDAPWSLKTSFFISGITSSMVLAFYGYRLRLMSGGWITPAICWFLTFARTSLVLANFILNSRMIFSQFKEKYYSLLATTITLCFVLDIYTAAVLCYYLARNKVGFEGSDRLINRLMRLSVETGLLASLLDLAMLITFFALPNSYVFTALWIIAGERYANTLLFSLNSRTRHRDDHTTIRKCGSGHTHTESREGIVLTTIPRSISIRSKMTTVMNYPQSIRRDVDLRSLSAITEKYETSSEDKDVNIGEHSSLENLSIHK